METRRRMETKTRSLIKALSWRVLASLITSAVIFGFTGNVSASLLVGVLDSAIKIFIYFAHERVWAAIPFGQAKGSVGGLVLTKPLTAEDQRIIAKKLEELGYLPESHETNSGQSPAPELG